jgi:integrase
VADRRSPATTHLLPELEARRLNELTAGEVERWLADRAERLSTDTVGERWVDHDLVSARRIGTPLDAANVRRGFRSVVAAAGLPPEDWTPRELRHGFVSLLSSSGMSIEDISHLVGHASTRVTETVYRKELRPVLTRGARDE